MRSAQPDIGEMELDAPEGERDPGGDSPGYFQAIDFQAVKQDLDRMVART